LKNQYFGDQNDYFKYDLLIFLAEGLSGLKRLSAIWMLTANDKSNDGGKRGYPTGKFRDSLHEFLQNPEHPERKVSRLKNYFEKRSFGFEFHSYRDDLESGEFRDENRDQYFAEIPDEFLKSALVFIDPDNGLEPRAGGGKDKSKYVKLSDLDTLLGRMDTKSIAVIYQHLPRMHRKLFLYGLQRDLKQNLKDFQRCPVPISIHNNQIAFLIVAKEKRRQEEVKTLLGDYVRSDLQILD
jgi:hypothetical protein